MSEQCVFVCNHIYNIVTSVAALAAFGWSAWQHFQLKKHDEILVPKK